MKQTAIPSLFMRGGTSKGIYFRSDDLPTDIQKRDAILLAAMGSPDTRQIDGVGGAHPLTSKVAIVGKSALENCDLDFLFAQLQPNSDIVDTTPNCGNMLAAVVPFALETQMIKATGDTSTFSVRTLNTDMIANITVQTPLDQTTNQRYVEYEGNARIDGVPKTAAPIKIEFLDTAGSVCGSLLPTGHVKDTITVQPMPHLPAFTPFELEVTCIDNGMPLVILRAADVQRTGLESIKELNEDTELKTKLEALRLQISEKMGLGDVRQKNFPKMTLVAPPTTPQGCISTRSFIPHVCHDAIGVLAAVTVATAGVLRGSVMDGLAVVPEGNEKLISVEHPTGEFSVELGLDAADDQKITHAALLRTARLIMKGEVMVPSYLGEPSV